MEAFKRGDEVKCISTGDNNLITKGKIYTIYDSNKRWTTITFNDSDRIGTYHTQRFELYLSKIMNYEKVFSLIGKKIIGRFIPHYAPYTVRAVTTYNNLG